MKSYEAQIAEMYENAPILGRDISSSTEAPVIRVASLGEFEALTTQLLSDFGWEPERVATRVAEHVEHEGDHARAARKVGAKVVGYCARLWRSESGLNNFLPYTHISCKALNGDALRYASILLYPTEPSDGDIEMANGIDYDVERVGREAEQLRESGIIIPIPRSYIPTTREIIDLAA